MSEAIEPKKVANLKIGRRDLIDLAVADAYRDLKKLRDEARGKMDKSVQAYVDAVNRAAVEKAAPVLKALKEVGSVPDAMTFLAEFTFHYIRRVDREGYKPLHLGCRFYVNIPITAEIRALHDEAVKASEEYEARTEDVSQRVIRADVGRQLIRQAIEEMPEGEALLEMMSRLRLAVEKKTGKPLLLSGGEPLLPE